MNLMDAATLNEEDINRLQSTHYEKAFPFATNDPSGHWESVIDQRALLRAARNKALGALLELIQERAAYVENDTGPPHAVWILDALDMDAIRAELEALGLPQVGVVKP